MRPSRYEPYELRVREAVGHHDHVYIEFVPLTGHMRKAYRAALGILALTLSASLATEAYLHASEPFSAATSHIRTLKDEVLSELQRISLSDGFIYRAK